MTSQQSATQASTTSRASEAGLSYSCLLREQRTAPPPNLSAAAQRFNWAQTTVRANLYPVNDDSLKCAYHTFRMAAMHGSVRLPTIKDTALTFHRKSTKPNKSKREAQPESQEQSLRLITLKNQ